MLRLYQAVALVVCMSTAFEYAAMIGRLNRAAAFLQFVGTQDCQNSGRAAWTCADGLTYWWKG